MYYYAGIDGGGTKTTLIIRSNDGSKEYRITFGAFNINSIGEIEFSSTLDSIIKELKKAGECLHLTIGAAGVSNSKMQEIVKKKIVAVGIEYDLIGDHLIALEGAHGGAPGLAVIAGTGSICFGKGEDGVLHRTGGWGHLIGDEGSAYSLSKDAFSAIAKVFDGYGKDTLIKNLLSEKLHLKTRDDCIRFIYSGDKSVIASVAPIICEAYEKNDEVAVSIIKNNASLLFDALNGVRNKARLSKAYVSFFGGLLDKNTPFRREFMSLIEKHNSKFEYRNPLFDAAEGAVMLAEKTFIEKKMENS